MLITDSFEDFEPGFSLRRLSCIISGEVGNEFIYSELFYEIKSADQSRKISHYILLTIKRDSRKTLSKTCFFFSRIFCSIMSIDIGHRTKCVKRLFGFMVPNTIRI